MQAFAFHAAKALIVAPGGAAQLAEHVCAWADAP
jgi:hypothetical protein